MKETALIPFHFRNRIVRGLTIDGQPWFVAKDVCDVLELENVTRAVESLDDDELTLLKVRAGNQQREMNCVSESGLYALIFKSRKPEARAFRKWVTSEVLPALRRRRRYAMPDAPPEDCAPIRASRADIFHHRGPVSRSGLDIRYALDLTRIALNPNPRSLEVLQRLTGVDMDDLIEEMESAGVSAGPDAFADWFGSCCEDAQGYCATVRDLYDSLRRWSREKTNGKGCCPSRKAMSQWLAARGYLRRRPGGVSTFYGFRIA